MRRGHKVGPLTALDEATAEALFAALAAEARGELGPIGRTLITSDRFTKTRL
jgi:hypothetical protein